MNFIFDSGVFFKDGKVIVYILQDADVDDPDRDLDAEAPQEKSWPVSIIAIHSDLPASQVLKNW